MSIRFCRDYTYCNVGLSFGDICGALVATLNLGFWSVEIVIRESNHGQA